jgi:hypothetical protein
MRKQKPEKIHAEEKQNSSFSIEDPIYLIIGKMSVPFVWGAILAFNIVVYVAVGLMINKIYPSANPEIYKIQRITDPAEIMNGVNVWVIFVPALWAYYRWFPEKVLKNFITIEERGIISPVSATPISKVLQRRLASKWVYIIAALAAVISVSYALLILAPMQEIEFNGLINFWYYTWWSKLFYLILYAPANFIFFAYVMRALITVVTINSYFQQPFVIRSLYPLHSDKCGGIGEIGYLASKTVLIIVLVPIWIGMFSLYSILTNGKSMMLTLGIVYILYLILAPIILALFLWQPHKAMEQFKVRQLDEISCELLWIKNSISEKIKDTTHGQEINKELERYKQLLELYENLEKHIPVWPISVPALRSFGAFTSSPVILGFLSNILLDYMKNRYLGI